MKRIVFAFMAAAILVAGIAASAECMAGGCYPAPVQCGPQRSLITKMVPCMRTELVAEVKPCVKTVPVQRVGYRLQNFMVCGTPVGQPCGLDPCTKCCPQPFKQVVQQKVPYVYYEPQCVQSYEVVYRPVCRPVMVPQTYMVETTPMCR